MAAIAGATESPTMGNSQSLPQTAKNCKRQIAIVTPRREGTAAKGCAVAAWNSACVHTDHEAALACGRRVL